MRAVLLVPRRDDEGHRDRLWEWCRARWERYFPDLPIYEGHHDDGPFNRSAAINRAAERADEDGRWDVGIVIDSDVFLRVSQVRKAIATAHKTGRVTWAHRRWRGFHQDHTMRTIKAEHPIDFGAEVDADDMDVYVERTNPLSWSCCVAIPRAVWDELGGFDERFVGWGFEDMAFKSVVTGLFGWERIAGDVYHLWHPRSEERIVKGRPATTATREYAINARLGRRYMIAAYRDVGVGDEPGEQLTDELRAKNIRNLTLDDARMAAQSRHHKLPEWTTWWPTLRELVEGARIHRAEQRTGSVTMVVHTGGTAEAWPERREYLSRTMATLERQVTGPIIQRVIYDCWGDPAIRTWLTEQFGRMGFYVVGPVEQLGYTDSMHAMWTYLRKRAKGDFIFHTEDDFTFERPVDLVPMIAALRANSNLTQMALLRDPYYDTEREAGGILGHPETAFTRRDAWIEHRLFWTANPSLFRKALTERPWPKGRHSETLFGRQLFDDARLRSAFWGQGEEWVKHIGQVRAGAGY